MVRREWDQARAKVNAEGVCRICKQNPPGGNRWLEAAHVIGREHDTLFYQGHIKFYRVEPESIVPLCRPHHAEYDAHQLDLLPYLTREEETDAVRKLGIARALKRTTGQKEVA